MTEAIRMQGVEEIFATGYSWPASWLLFPSNFRKDQGWGALQQLMLFEALAEILIEPTFVTQFRPRSRSLARKNYKDPGIIDRFELFIGAKRSPTDFRS